MRLKSTILGCIVITLWSCIPGSSILPKKHRMVIEITTIYRSMPAAEIEQSVSPVIAKPFYNFPGIEQVTEISKQDTSIVIIRVEKGVKSNPIAIAMDEHLDTISRYLPEGMISKPRPVFKTTSDF